jgi:xanthine dehydrogenase small subunit
VQTEAAVVNQTIDAATLAAAKAALTAEIAPIDDVRSTRRYRLQVALNLLEDFLSSLASN